MAELLERLEFQAQLHDDYLLVTGPDYRLDIDGPHDLVEEICRLYRYDRIPSTVIADTLPPQRGNPKLEHEEQVKDILVRQGLNEVITYRLTSARMEQKILAAGAVDDRPYVTITNPNSPERAVMRHNLLTSVMEIAASNSRFQERIAIFEVGPVYIVDEEAILPQELTRLAIVMAGQRGLTNWQDGEPATVDFFDLKGVLEGLFAELHLEAQYEPTRHPSYRPGRTARILLGDQQIGIMGELHPLVVEKFDMHLEVDQPVLATELDLDTIIAHVPFAYPFEAISPYPAVHEDLALVVDKGVAAAAVASTIRRAGGYLLKEVQLFDLYEGAQIPAGKKSLAYHLTFQAPDKTLTDKQVSKNRQRILSQLQNELGATLR
jgi:phenylalanyl-tRNA synthetase beta chain